MSDVKERGRWHVVAYPFTEGGALRVDIQSDDFIHDVALTVTGNFETSQQRITYAEEIAQWLNTSTTTFGGAIKWIPAK